MAFKHLPVVSKTVVRTRESGTGRVTSTKAIVLKAAKSNNFSRAYGKQVRICTVHGKKGRQEVYVSEVGAGDVVPVGKAKRIPAMCKRALVEYEKSYGK